MMEYHFLKSKAKVKCYPYLNCDVNKYHMSLNPSRPVHFRKLY